MIIAAGLVASMFVVMLSFTIQRRNIVIVSSLLACSTIVQYALLGKYMTVALASITLLYGFTVFFEKRYPILRSNIALTVLVLSYSATFFAFNGLSFSVEIMALLASLSGVLLMAISNQIFAKWLMLINGITWLVYQLSSGAYGQIPGEIFFTAGVLFSLFSLYRAKSSGIDLDNVPELSTVFKNKIAEMFNKKQTVATV